MTETARPRRSATQSLLSIVLALDALLVFFVMMTAFGLNVLPAGIVFGGGISLIVIFALTGRVVSRPWGVWVGHSLQVVLIALGFVLTAMFLIGLLFAAIWVYCFFTGRRLDRRNAIFGAETSHPSDTPPTDQEQL